MSEVFTRNPGKYVHLTENIAGFKGINMVLMF